MQEFGKRLTRTQGEGESVRQKVSMVANLTPSTHLSRLVTAPPPTPLSVLSFSAAPLVFVWVRPESDELKQKNSVCHGEKAKVLAFGWASGWRD